MPHRSVHLSSSIRLRPTLSPLSLGWGTFAPDGWWRAFRTPAGGATVRVSRTGDLVTGTGWGPGGDWVLERLPDLVGQGDQGGFHTDHPLIGRLNRTEPSRFGRTGLVVEALIYAILGQKVTRREAATALRGISRRYSERAPGPRDDLWLPPDPDRVAAAPYHAFHALAVEKRRADTLRRVAGRASRLEATAVAAPEAAGALMHRFPGVGRWTVAETVVVSHGHVDAVSVGDFHLKHQVSWHLAGEERGTDERMLELLEPFRGHRARVVRLVAGLGGYPSRGPRLPVRSFAGF
jgi:hypothetical protein